jgi:hypothetical protein
MTAKRNLKSRASRVTAACRGHTKRVVLVGAGSLAGAAAVALAFGGLLSPSSSTSSAATVTFPSASTTGVPAGTVLKSVPGQVSSGTGWKFISSSGGYVSVTGAGAVLTGLSIPYNVNVTASNVTLKNDKIATAGNYGISLRHTAGVTIENSTVSGANATSGRVQYAIDDIYEDSTGIVVSGNNVSDFCHGVQVSAGLVTGNYIHDPGYVAGDHIDGIFDPGFAGALMISGNTILDSFTQTSAISLDASAAGTLVANKTVENNLLGGGGYAIYGGDSLGNTTSNIVIKNNRFSQAYFPKSGQYGPIAYYNPKGTGNSWSGNVWDSSGQTIPSP